MSDIRNFDDKFNPLQWKGFRAQQFTKEEDAFQQLIGDALKHQFFDHAFVSATSGRDGSIDAWVEKTAEIRKPFSDFAFPLIVECKHHDATLNNLSKNIARGWSEVKQKLIKNADANWPDKYSPWQQAKGYLYCISARFSSAHEKIEFRNNIRDFFSNLPEQHRPPFRLEDIHVWDWNDITYWLRQSGKLADDWLGIGFEALEDHGTYQKRLNQIDSGFHAYLLAKKLTFIEPDSSDLFHPQHLRQRLSQGESLVLVGEGGVGKTRTVFEVAEYLHHNGWRVLHLRPTDKGVDLGAITDELLRHAGYTLVIIDYIDQFRDFDVRYWNQTLLPEASKRNVHLTLLANARPLAASKILRNLVDQKLFSIIDMKPSAVQREQVTRQIEKVICPQAIQILGETEVRKLCGPRPIIAMFIARELEHLAEKNELTVDTLPHSGDLRSWILRRFQEDIPPSEVPVSPWEPASPSPILCAITAALTVCPMTEGELTGAVMATLQAIPNANHHTATHIITTLRQGGWLEEEGYNLRTPHDAVADEILQGTLHEYKNTLPILFAGAKHGRPLGRIATSLGRLAEQGDTCAPLFTQAEHWLKQEAVALSESLIDAEPDATAYALGAVLDCPPLSVTAMHIWPQLITPWLEKYSHHPAARHLLHRGLKQLPEQEAYQLRNVSLNRPGFTGDSIS